MPTGPLTPSQTVKLLQQENILPRKTLGQNFLIDPNLVRKSLQLADISPDEAILEVGPGLGTLTAALLEAGCHVWAVEKDPKLAQFLRSSLLPQYPQSFHLLEADALEHPRAEFQGDNFKVVANLPYAISTPWMEKLLHHPLPSRMVLMLQKEAADRFTASHGSKLYGPVSVLLELTYQRKPGHPVSRQCFHPAPEVDSTLLVLQRLPNPRILPPEARSLLRNLFGQRRKQALARLRRDFPDHPASQHAPSILESHGIPLTARPEQIPAGVWWELLSRN